MNDRRTNAMPSRLRRTAALLALLAAASPAGAQAPAWVPAQPDVIGGPWGVQGPGPSNNGQLEGIPNRPVTGAVNALAAHPTNPDILYLGAVNGGVWRTLNAAAASPVWTPLMDGQSSLSIGSAAPAWKTARSRPTGRPRWRKHVAGGRILLGDPKGDPWMEET